MAYVQRNFQLPAEQADWLREVASRRGVKQAELVRYALDATRAELDGRPRPAIPGGVPRPLSALAGRLAGPGDRAAALLEDRRREAGR